MTTPSPSDQSKAANERALMLAESDIEHIGILLDTPAFNAYFVRRLRERRDKLCGEIAYDDTLSDLETRTRRFMIKEYESLIRMPAQDRSAHTATIASMRQ